MKVIGRLILIGASIALLGSLATNWAEEEIYGSYRNPLWADKSGYYIYLPFAFDYKFDVSAMPEELEARTGNGFTIENGKLITKYPVGVAYMELPFYITAFISNRINHFPENAYQGEYVRFMVLAPAVYTTLGLFLLFLSLRLLHIKAGIAFGLSVFTLIGTSLFYYSIIEGLMSHAFSFFLFAAFTYLWIKLLKGAITTAHLIFTSLIIALVLAVRPFNAVLLVVYALALLQVVRGSWGMFVEVVLRLIPWAILIILVVFIPQLVYYNYAFGSFFVDAYSGETFDFAHPKIINMLLSPNAGLFVYVPALGLLFLASIYKAIQEHGRFSAIGIFLFLMVYVLASWHSWSYGCGFGIRPFVEWLPLLIIPVAWLLNKARPWVYLPTLALIVLVSWYNISMTFKWTGCWFGKEDTFAEFMRIFWPNI